MGPYPRPMLSLTTMTILLISKKTALEIISGIGISNKHLKCRTAPASKTWAPSPTRLLHIIAAGQSSFLWICCTSRVRYRTRLSRSHNMSQSRQASSDSSSMTIFVSSDPT